MPFWEGLSENEKKSVACNATLQRYLPRTILNHNTDELCPGLQIVSRGRVRVFIKSADNKQLTLQRILNNEPFVIGVSCALDRYVEQLTRSMKVYDTDHPEGFPNLELDHLAHLRGLMILVKLVLSDFRDDAKSLRETKECLEILGIKPAPKP